MLYYFLPKCRCHALGMLLCTDFNEQVARYDYKSVSVESSELIHDNTLLFYLNKISVGYTLSKKCTNKLN